MRKLFALLLIVGVPANAQDRPVAAADIGRGETLLEVAAEGRASATPDRAALQGGVTTNAPTAREAILANATAMTAVIDALRAAGISSQDIRTTNVSLEPQRDIDARGRPVGTISSYTANNSVIITIRDLSKLSDYLSALFESGANNVSGPVFRVDSDSTLIQQARLDAVARARREAETYAEAFGMRVDRVIRISERGSRQERGRGYVEDPRIPSFSSADRMQSVPTMSVSIGQVEQVAYLWVDFALAPR